MTYWLLDCGTALADLSLLCFPCWRRGSLSGFEELFPSWTLVSPLCCIFAQFCVLMVWSPSRGCVVADRSVAWFCGLRNFLHDLFHHTVLDTGALVATSDVSCVKLLGELKDSASDPVGIAWCPAQISSLVCHRAGGLARGVLLRRSLSAM